jgi:poly-gamma-glutamate synthesis protein (capsule biosynthesis protein)
MAVTTVLVGDTNLQKRARPVEAFARIAPLLSQKEILFGHAEGMFTTRAANAARTSLLYKERWRHSTPKIATGFVEAGFDGVCFASNVCANRDDVRETIEAGKRAGLAFCGIGENARHARAPLFIEHSEATVALLSRTSVFWPHLVPATEGEPGAATVAAHTAYGPGRRALEMPGAPPIVHTWADPAELELLCSDIAAARSRADHVVLSVHWGVSGSHEVLE